MKIGILIVASVFSLLVITQLLSTLEDLKIEESEIEEVPIEAELIDKYYVPESYGGSGTGIDPTTGKVVILSGGYTSSYWMFVYRLPNGTINTRKVSPEEYYQFEIGEKIIVGFEIKRREN